MRATQPKQRQRAILYLNGEMERWLLSMLAFKIIRARISYIVLMCQRLRQGPQCMFWPPGFHRLCGIGIVWRCICSQQLSNRLTREAQALSWRDFNDHSKGHADYKPKLSSLYK